MRRSGRAHGLRSASRTGAAGTGDRPDVDLSNGAAGGAKLLIVEPGERMLIWCEGGPSLGRAVYFPPPLEIGVEGGVYVLVDDGPPEEWHYQFVKSTGVAW